MNSIFYRRLSLLLSLTTVTVLGTGFSAQAETITVPGTVTNSAADLTPQLAERTSQTSAPRMAQVDTNTEPSPGVDTTPSPDAAPVPDQTAPVPDQTAPVPDQTAPVPDQTAPIPDQTAPAPTGAISFTDVAADYWAGPFIQALAARNVIAGFPDGTFKPEQPVSRAEFAAMVQKAFPQQLVQRQLSPGGFSDVPADYWAASAIQTAYQTGFMNGYPNNLFLPNQEIPKAQAITALANGLGLTASEPAANVVSSYYTDAAQIPSYAVDQVAAATQANVVVNYPDVRVLNPQVPLTRAEAAAHLYQALVRLGQEAPLPANVAAANYIVGGPGAVSQATPTTPTTPEQTAPTEETPPTSGIQPGRATRGGSSYIGVGANFGLSGDADLGDDVNFAVFSKIGVLNSFSIRPSAVIGSDPTVLIPITYDFNFQRADVLNRAFSIAPYIGAGVGIKTGDETDVGFLLTGGLDVPITGRFTATAAVNALFGDDTDVGVWVGVGYNFGGF